MNIRVRKINRSGKQPVIGLPPDWLRGNDLDIGDEVEIRYDGEVHIRPHKPEAKPGEGKPDE